MQVDYNDDDRDQSQCSIRVANVKGLVTVLHSIKPANNKQECTVLIGPEDGLSVRIEDDSKGLQSSVFMRPDLFAAVDCPNGRQMFGMQFSLLLDTLQVFASIPGQELEMRFPGPNHELVLEMNDESDNGICTYARINTLDLQTPRDMLDFWQDPSTFFIISGALLKEAVEDLEWAASGGHQSARGNVHLLLREEPRAIVLRATGAGTLEVDFPTQDNEDLHGFSCAAPEVACCYKHKHLRAAFCNIPHHQKDSTAVSTKVMIDSQGLMKVTHMISVSGAGGATQYGGQHAISQGGMERKGVVQFVVLPEEDYVDE